MSPEQRNQFIILGALGLVLAVVFWFMVLRPKPGAGPTQDATESAGAASTTAVSVFEDADVDIDELIKNIKEVDFRYAETQEARDPLHPLTKVIQTRIEFESGSVEEKQHVEELIYEANRKNLTGILWDKIQPLAVVDNDIVHVGFEFPEGIVVSSIERTLVVLTLELENENIDIVKELKEQ